jgi:uroporphyrinogen-III decarboxylase
MAADDYEALINDPTDFWIRRYMPRIFKSLIPLAHIAPFPNMWEIVGISGQFIPFGIPGVQKALQALIDAGSEAFVWAQKMGSFEKKAKAMGYPTPKGGVSKAPYDILADTLRGTRGIMMDLFRQPDKIIKAMERLVPIYINQGVSMADKFGCPIVFMPLHKGADGFMSDEQFRTFYWPTLKAVIMGLVAEGCVPYLFAEGSFDSRLDYLKELPEASCFWIFDRTDMGIAKKEIGGSLCIGGNVPAGLVLTGTPTEMEDYCKHLIDIAGDGGGYIMSFGTSMDEGNAENIKTMIQVTRDYGIYS